MGTWGLAVAIICAQAANEPSSLAKQPSKKSMVVAKQVSLKSKPVVPKKLLLHEHPTLVRMLDENNRLRQGVGLPPQQMSPELAKAAQDHARYMARTGSFSHYSNGGPGGRCAKHGYHGSAAENIAMGYQSIKGVFQGWRASSGHWSNIRGNGRVAGFGYAKGPDGSGYWVGMYAY